MAVIDLTNPEDTNRVVNELKKHFAYHSIWEYEDFLGDGEYAVAVLVRKRSRTTNDHRMVLKKAKGRDSENQLKNEISWLKRLRGAEHIVRMLAAHDGTMSTSAGSVSGSALQGLTNPIMAMQYLENGSFSRLMERLRQKNMHLPNRILWSFFLCLVRACVGLAYPPDGREEDSPELEAIPTDGRLPTDLYHGDLHAGNIMIGDIDPKSAEHYLAPVVEFIDFGEAAENSEYGVTENLYKISLRMLGLIARGEIRLRRAESEYNGIRTLATEILPGGNGARYPRLDPDLRDLLARCVSTQRKHRPGLQEMLEITRNAVETKDASSFKPNQAYESDEAISIILRTLIFDGDTAPFRL
ncbi:hypothetical protein F5B20DRAFT_574518 [Whalleya microplaca]|nr:hypothetical protein F5B20DRAFT_574518 [Whalleya microplaca]